MEYDIKITNKGHKMFEQKITGHIVIYNHCRIDNTPVDLLEVCNEEGVKCYITSDNIDMQHYKSQWLPQLEKELGCKVGDNVKLVMHKSFGGYFKPGFDLCKPHVITEIRETGAVEFDDGKAYMVKPKMQLVEK